MPAPSAPGPVDRLSRVFGEGAGQLWRSGDLGGRCTGDDRTPIVDEVAIEALTLFDTDSDRLRPTGERVLDQLIERIDRYAPVREVTLHPQADGRGPDDYNDALAARRGAEVRRYLEARLDPVPPIREAPPGERAPVRADTDAAALQAERRVIARVIAEGVRPGRGSIALCASAGGGRTETATIRYTEPGADRLERFGGAMPLSVGDRLRLSVVGDETLDGLYEIGSDGTIDLPFVGAIRASGLRVEEFETRLGRRLAEGGFVRAAFAVADAAVLQWAPADVYVRGAVFAPGRRTVNALETPERAFRQTQDGGDSGRNRLLSSALSAAGGVRPDADLATIRVRRSGELLQVDLAGIVTGHPAEDFPLIDGDEIEVASLGTFQPELVRPTQITPPGMRVFISNLTVPATNNASSSVNKDATGLPYGSRMLQGLLSGNCVGGTQNTNASRRAVLVSTDPATGRIEVIERTVLQLLEAPDSEVVNPLLMPQDGIACYDSGVTNLRDVARAFSDVLTPLSLLKTLFVN